MDNKPISNSENLIKSDGVDEFTNRISNHHAYLTIFRNKIQFNKSSNQIIIPAETTIIFRKNRSYWLEEDIVVNLTMPNYGLVILNLSSLVISDAKLSYPNLDDDDVILFSYNKITGLLSLDDNCYLVDGKTPSGLKEAIEEKIDYYLEGFKESFVASVKENAYIDSQTLNIIPFETYSLTNPFYVKNGEKIKVNKICGA